MIFTVDTLLVKDILSRDYICLEKTISLGEFIEILLINNLSEGFIVDKSEKLIGIITLSDIARLKRAKVPCDTLIESVMSKNVISVGKEYTLLDCKELLKRHNVDRLPVIEHNKILGVIRYKEIEFYYYDEVEKAFTSYDLLLNNMYEAVHVVDKKGKVLLWNKSSENLYKLKEEEIVGKNISEIFDEKVYLNIKENLGNIENFYRSSKKGCDVITNAHPIVKNEKLLGIISIDRSIADMEYSKVKLNQIKRKIKLCDIK